MDGQSFRAGAQLKSDQIAARSDSLSGRRRLSYERPLTDEELADFGEAFSQYRSRAFTLPHISVAGILPGANKLIGPLQRLDGAVLKRFPSLDYYATVRVIEMVK